MSDDTKVVEKKEPAVKSKSPEDYSHEFTKGILKDNPVLVLLLGLCPTLAVTSTVANGLGMGVAATFVLICSNIFVSLLKDFIPEKVRIPAYIVIIASFVTVVDLLMKAFVPPLAKSLGIFVPLIVVNCVILGRAEAFANRNTVVKSILDALGMGLGFTLALILISFFREGLGSCQFDFSMYGLEDPITLPFIKEGIISISAFERRVELYSPAMIFTLPAGAFFVVGLILAAFNAIKEKISPKGIK